MTERLYRLTKKGKSLLEKLDKYNNNQHVKLVEKIFFTAKTKGDKKDELSKQSRGE
tara:strand:+ start:558 stop:725 length:168 start_codon:yes stop_codon:yes gene_type:complete